MVKVFIHLNNHFVGKFLIQIFAVEYLLAVPTLASVLVIDGFLSFHHIWILIIPVGKSFNIFEIDFSV
jgi:hypothetical protein